MSSPDKRHILLVEDDPDIARGLAIRLKAAGYEVSAAPDAVLAVSMAIKEQPDLIIMDIGLPGGNGHMVADRLRSNVKTTDIPVIFLTARADPESMRKAEAGGASGYLVKPYRPEELLSMISSVLNPDPGVA